MDDIILPAPVDVEAELDAIARRYRDAGGPAVRLLTQLGTKAEDLLDKLPPTARSGLNEATEKALQVAMKAAQSSRSAVPDQTRWVDRAVTTAMGAVGGFGGLPSALVELPMTTTMLLRSIQGVASEHGFNPDEEGVQFDCMRVFAVAGPLEKDDGADLGFLTVRLSLSGGAMHKMIAAVAPRLATVLGQKLAAQTVPVLGAVAGATTNYVFTTYYQEMAHVQFGLRRLAINADLPPEELIEKLRVRMQALPR